MQHVLMLITTMVMGLATYGLMMFTALEQNLLLVLAQRESILIIVVTMKTLQSAALV